MNLPTEYLNCTNTCTLAYNAPTVPLNYNFISTWMDMHGNKRYFACKMPNFAMEIKISTRHGISMRHDFEFTHMRNLIVYMVT